MNDRSPHPAHAIDRTLEHGLDDTAAAERATELRTRLEAPLTTVDLEDVLARAEAHIIAAREALTDEHEGNLTRAVVALVVEAFLAHRVVTTW